MKKPIIIIGCPRTGTLLASRILGISSEHFLITEHSNKSKYVPEDKSGIEDSKLWWQNFEYYLWDGKEERPAIETPVYENQRIRDIQKKYLNLAGSKRIVVKSPQHLTRIRFLKEIFPDAFFVFCIRNPWHTIQSMVIKGNKYFYLRTFANYALPSDPLLKAAFSWGEAVDIYLKEKDDRWLAVKYEDLVFNSKETISRLYHFLNIEDEEALKAAIGYPKIREHNYYFLKKEFGKSKYRENIIKSVELGCKIFTYPVSMDDLLENQYNYYSGKLSERLRSFNSRCSKAFGLAKKPRG